MTETERMQIDFLIKEAREFKFFLKGYLLDNINSADVIKMFENKVVNNLYQLRKIGLEECLAE